MGKSTNFSGQPIFNQLIKFIDKGDIKRISRDHKADRYVKKFSTYNHIVVMLFVTLEGYQSIREVITGLLASAHKLYHLGLSYIIRRSTFSEANARRNSKVFGDIYMSVYRRYGSRLADSRLSDTDLKRLYVMDSTTISLFNSILKGVGRNPKEGKKKGGVKAHTIIKASENVPCLIRYSEAVKHDHMFLNEVLNLVPGSIITFDKAYVDYGKYQEFSDSFIWYVTRLKDNAKYEAQEEFDIPDECDSGVLKDEEIILSYGEKKEKKHRSRRIAYWDNENDRLLNCQQKRLRLFIKSVGRSSYCSNS
jgi:hypothetical protein